MKNNLRAATLAATAMLVLGFQAGAAGAAPVTATAQAKAKVLKQISVSKSADLNFGTVVVSNTAGTVVIDADGVRNCGSGLTCSGATAAGAFTIAGTKNENVTISASPSVQLTSAEDSSVKMTATLALSTAALKLSNGGAGVFNVGGTLAVGASQADGLYEGSFNVTVDYQ